VLVQPPPPPPQQQQLSTTRMKPLRHACQSGITQSSRVFAASPAAALQPQKQQQQQK
jgi:hypothetical protein